MIHWRADKMSEFIRVVSGVGWGRGLAWVGGRLSQIYYVTVGRGLEVIITDSSKGIGGFPKKPSWALRNGWTFPYHVYAKFRSQGFTGLWFMTEDLSPPPVYFMSKNLSLVMVNSLKFINTSLRKLFNNLANGLHKIPCQICKINAKNAEINVTLENKKNLPKFKQIEKI